MIISRRLVGALFVSAQLTSCMQYLHGIVYGAGEGRFSGWFSHFLAGDLMLFDCVGLYLTGPGTQ